MLQPMAIELVELDLQIVGSCRLLGQLRQGNRRYRHAVILVGHLECLPECGNAVFYAPRPESRIFVPVGHLYVSTKLRNQLPAQSQRMNLVSVKSACP